MTKPWTQAEDIRLKDLLTYNTPQREIARLLGRSKDSVWRRVRALDRQSSTNLDAATLRMTVG